AGAYEVLSKGTEARFKIEPFFTSRPPQYKSPDFRATGAAFDLDTGFYVLTVEPTKKGILDVALRPKGLVGFVLESIGLGREVTAKPVRAAVQFPKTALDRESS